MYRLVVRFLGASVAIAVVAACGDGERYPIVPEAPLKAVAEGTDCPDCSALVGSQFLLVEMAIMNMSDRCQMEKNWLLQQLNGGSIKVHTFGPLGMYWPQHFTMKVSLDQYHFMPPWNSYTEIGTTLLHEAAHHYYGYNEGFASSHAIYCMGL